MNSPAVSCLLGVLVSVLATAIRYGSYYWIPGFRTYMLHVLTIVLMAQYCGTLAALSATLASVLGIIWYTPGWDAGHMLHSDFLALILFSISGVFLSLFSGHYAKLLHERSQALEELRQERVLRGLLPTCSVCKRIRDAAGQWHAIEEYISSRSEAEFSHSMCEQCYEDVYVHPPQPEPKNAEELLKAIRQRRRVGS